MRWLVDAGTAAVVFAMGYALGLIIGAKDITHDELECQSFDGGKVVCISEGETTNDAGL